MELPVMWGYTILFCSIGTAILILAEVTSESKTDEEKQLDESMKQQYGVSAPVMAWGYGYKKQPSDIGFFQNKTIKKMSLSEDIDCAIEENGSVHVRMKQKEWITLTDEKDIIDCATASSNIYLVTQNGDLLMANINDNELKFDICNIPEPIRSVFANDKYTALISQSGTVYTKGDNDCGQCGHGHRNKVETFTPIETKYFDSLVKEIALGANHVVFLTEKGRIFTCGSDDHMQLGLGFTKQKCWLNRSNWDILGEKGYEYTIAEIGHRDSNTPFFEVPRQEYRPRVVLGPYFDNSRVISIAAGDCHTAVVVEQDLGNRVISWGGGYNGQLGHSNIASMKEPKAITPLEQVIEYDEALGISVRCNPIEVACGKEHTLVLIEGRSHESGGMVFGCGYNNHCQVANQRSKRVTKPYWIQAILPHKNFSIHHIAAGYYKSAVF